MHTGMLWWMDKHSTMTLDQQIKRAAAHYEKKYERKPNLCLINPGMMGPAEPAVDVKGITVRAYGPVLPGQIWIGVEDMPTERKEETPT